MKPAPEIDTRPINIELTRLFCLTDPHSLAVEASAYILCQLELYKLKFAIAPLYNL